ncbi:hypothetical protein PIGHUM_00400 [Pigmentiphaga humi]|uniref:Uncharacterized protein n=1 Tax=Pigmentiphaga humi TaxID=2478468 RepID=A0A3P4AWA4_9BURK|nr:hypothetical protein [Pigmentiphaga humi]VCU68349.1 hypothetical protein PIGHUM_00400 [Pigmentiphaga humi]
MPAEADLRQAAALQRLWNELALQHVAMGGGACACGIGGVVVRLQDFERDIVDYLQAEAARLGEQEAGALLDRHAAAAGADGAGLAEVLGELADPAAQVPQAAAHWLLARLDRTLTSFARLHGGR